MKNTKLRILCEGAVLVAAALALSYLKIPTGLAFGGFGGSVDLVMIPLVFFAVRRGAVPGIGAGLIFGTLKYIFAGGVAINWQSILLDYSLAYMAVGLAGVMKNRKWGLVTGGFIGCVGRFVIHFISGITIYAALLPDEFMSMTMTNVRLYSLLYNCTYMLPNTVLVIVIGAAITVPLSKYITGKDVAG